MSMILACQVVLPPVLGAQMHLTSRPFTMTSVLFPPVLNRRICPGREEAGLFRLLSIGSSPFSGDRYELFTSTVGVRRRTVDQEPNLSSKAEELSPKA